MKRGAGRDLAISLAPVILGLGAIALATLLLNACGARHDEKATADNLANVNTSARPGDTPGVTPAMSPAPTKAGPTPSTEKTVVEKPVSVPLDSPEQQTGDATPAPTQTVPGAANSNGVGSSSDYGTGPGRGGPPVYNPNPVRRNPGNTDYNRVFNGREVNLTVRILEKPEPVYTAAARNNQVTGTVVLSVVLTASGQVTDIKVVTGLPDGLSEAAIAAARRLKFTPALLDGRPVSMYMQLQYNFNLY